MSGKASRPASPRARTSEGKLFQVCLSACIDGIQKLRVDKRANCATNAANHNTHGDLDYIFNQYCATTLPEKLEVAKTLLSPPPAPSSSPLRRAKSPLVQPLPTNAIMDRSRWHNAPPRDPAPSAWGSQDVRSNLAVQPAANAGAFKLKKNAVKIVGAASAAASTQPKATAPASQTASSPIPGPVKAQSKGTDGPIAVKATMPVPPTPASKPVLPRIEVPKQSSAAESALDDLFSRLMTKSPATKGPTTPVPAPEGISLAGPDKAKFSFDYLLKNTEASKVFESPMTKPSSATPTEKKLKLTDKVGPQEKVEDGKENTNMSKEQLETEYLRKADEYIKTLPAGQGTAAHTLQVVLEKLRTSYAPELKLTANNTETLKARYAFAVVNYINKVLKKGAKPLTAELVKQILKDNNGNFLSLCATLVEEQYMSLENIKDISGLCNAILDILPKADPAVQAPTKTTASATTTPVVQEPKLGYKDPVDSMTTWPSQDKRVNAPTCRTCILKGVSGVTSINQLQALVWGGRLEAISMPEPGSDNALVKFLTPEGFQKYFEATENGIELNGDKKTLVFVEKTQGPNSINDVIRNCIEGDTTRCVRAVGAEEDWSDVLLLRLARGKGQSKREVDRIKRGKTARGHYYIEFRFANIYHALAFRRLLMDDEEWEHCTISYAPDPCETARGMHYKDEDETGSNFPA